MRRTRVATGLRAAALVGSALALAGCTSASAPEGGSTLSNLFNYGGTTAPPIAATPVIEVTDCPPVDVAEGGAAIRSVAAHEADAAAVRSQISIANVARECTGRPDGSIVVKVGVQGRALAGPGGTIARSDVPVYFVLKRGDTILASQSRRVAVSVEPGGVQGSFVVVENNLVVPPGIGSEFEIEVGLGSTPGAAHAATPKRRRARG